MRRIEERKATKKSDVAHRATTDDVKLVTGTGNKMKRGKREDDDVSEVITREMVAPSEISKKTSLVRRDTVGADTIQREAAMQWASEGTSDTNVVTQSTIAKGSVRQRGAKKATEKRITTATEDQQSMDVQNFIAGQYPPIEEGVSSTVRLGRAFVSGALGRRTDDPKIFVAAVNIVECDDKLLTTNRKAKIPVSAAPPNSIDSEAECDGLSHNINLDVLLSQSATDLGTHIDLPGVDAQTEPQVGDGNEKTISVGPGAPDTPVDTELVSTPLMSHAGEKALASGLCELGN